VSTLEEIREERQRLEARRAEIKGIDQAVEDARRAEGSAARAERRERAAARQLVDNKQSQHDAILGAAFEQLKSFVHDRQELDRARAEVAAAERAARAVGVELPRSYRAREIEFFDSATWRAFHDQLRQILGSGKVMG
jgi:DNA repair exonuclease SbcCD ATPase subunit